MASTTNFQQLYYHLVHLEIKHTLELLKPYMSEEAFADCETYFEANEGGIVVESLIEYFAHTDVEIPEEARIQLGILAEVMHIDIDTLLDPASTV